MWHNERLAGMTCPSKINVHAMVYKRMPRSLVYAMDKQKPQPRVRLRRFNSLAAPLTSWQRYHDVAQCQAHEPADHQHLSDCATYCIRQSKQGSKPHPCIAEETERHCVSAVFGSCCKVLPCRAVIGSQCCLSNQRHIEFWHLRWGCCYSSPSKDALASRTGGWRSAC